MNRGWVEEGGGGGEKTMSRRCWEPSVWDTSDTSDVSGVSDTSDMPAMRGSGREHVLRRCVPGSPLTRWQVKSDLSKQIPSFIWWWWTVDRRAPFITPAAGCWRYFGRGSGRGRRITTPTRNHPSRMRCVKATLRGRSAPPIKSPSIGHRLWLLAAADWVMAQDAIQSWFLDFLISRFLDFLPSRPPPSWVSCGCVTKCYSGDGSGSSAGVQRRLINGESESSPAGKRVRAPALTSGPCCVRLREEEEEEEEEEIKEEGEGRRCALLPCLIFIFWNSRYIIWGGRGWGRWWWWWWWWEEMIQQSSLIPPLWNKWAAWPQLVPSDAASETVWWLLSAAVDSILDWFPLSWLSFIGNAVVISFVLATESAELAALSHGAPATPSIARVWLQSSETGSDRLDWLWKWSEVGKWMDGHLVGCYKWLFRPSLKELATPETPAHGRRVSVSKIKNMAKMFSRLPLPPPPPALPFPNNKQIL